MQFRFNVEHLGLAARDPLALAAWYKEVLDAELVFQCENPGRPSTLFVRMPGGLILEIYPSGRPGTDASDNACAGWRHLALQVPAIARARTELETRGVNFADPTKPAGGGGQVLFFADPEGNLLHLVERPANSIFALNPEEPEND